MHARNSLGAAAVLGFALAAFAGSAQAAPLSEASRMLSHSSALTDRPRAETVGWQRRRHCRRHHGRKVCNWRRSWVPGLSIQIGPKYRHHRNRGHHRHHRRRH